MGWVMILHFGPHACRAFGQGKGGRPCESIPRSLALMWLSPIEFISSQFAPTYHARNTHMVALTSAVLSTDNRPGTELGNFVAVLASLGGRHSHASDLEGGLLSVGLCGCKMNHVTTKYFSKNLYSPIYPLNITLFHK